MQVQMLEQMVQVFMLAGLKMEAGSMGGGMGLKRGNITLIGQLKADQFYLDNMKGMNDFIDDGGDDTFVLAGHARIVNGIPTGEILINDKWYNAEALVELLPDIGYKPGQDIRLISCRYSGVLGAFFGIGPWLKSNGTWNVFQNGKLIGVTKDE